MQGGNPHPEDDDIEYRDQYFVEDEEGNRYIVEGDQFENAGGEGLPKFRRAYSEGDA